MDAKEKGDWRMLHLINPETQLEQAIISDPEWLAGVMRGEPRPGHPEGKVLFHIQDVLNNINRHYGNDEDRACLRLAALVHDSFKGLARAQGRPHGRLAREFAERYIRDPQLLIVVEWHDEPYKAWKLLQQGRTAEVERRAGTLIAHLRMANCESMFMKFYRCDNLTEGKSTEHYDWFNGLLRP
jgi:hypothetical protein